MGEIRMGASKVKEFSQSVFYRVNCDCMEGDHDVTLHLEFDKDFGDLSLNIYQDLEYSTYWNRDLIDVNSIKDISKYITEKLGIKDEFLVDLIGDTMWDSIYRINDIARLRYRLSGAFRILFKGYIKTSGHLMMYHEDHVQSFIDALVEGRNKILKNKEEKKKGKNNG